MLILFQVSLGQLCMPSFGLEKLASIYIQVVWLHSIDQGFCRWSPTLFQVVPRIYQKGKRRDLRGCRNCASGLCCHVECYDVMIAALSLSELSVYLDICCLKYVDKLRKDCSSLHHHYLHLDSSDGRHHHKTLPKTSTALCRNNLFYNHIWLQHYLFIDFCCCIF